MRISSALVIVALYAGSVAPLAAQSAQEGRVGGARSAAPQAGRPGPFLDYRASTPAPILNDSDALRRSAAVAPDLTSEWVAIAIVAAIVVVVLVRMTR